MKKISEMEDYLRPEYDFGKLTVVARGPGRRKSTETTVTLASDVAKIFPNSDAVNEALRVLARAAKRSNIRAKQ